jgi:hypothetical protein
MSARKRTRKHCFSASASSLWPALTRAAFLAVLLGFMWPPQETAAQEALHERTQT